MLESTACKEILVLDVIGDYQQGAFSNSFTARQSHKQNSVRV